MWAYMIVEPANLKPRRLRSAASASDSLVRGGICFVVFQRFTIGRPSTKLHI
jgi:hypothetical protein